MKISNGLKVAMVYGSVFIGAGFASGQELLQYFVGFGYRGILGLIVAGVLFSLVGWAVLNICRREKISDYRGLMRYLMGPKLGALMEGAVAGFLFCLLLAMLAGAGATGLEAFGLPFSVGALMIGGVVFFVLCFGVEGIIKVNLWLAPFMLFGGIFIGFYSYFTYSVPAFAFFGSGLSGFQMAFLISAVVYAAYNLVTAVPVLAGISGMSATKKSDFIGGVFGGGIITAVGIIMALPLFLYYSEVIGIEIPFIYIVSRYGGIIYWLYLAVLIAALTTTAACNGFAVLEWLKGRMESQKSVGSNNEFKRAKMAGIICLLAFFGAHIGFSNIVAYVYPAFGLLGVFKIFVILLSAVRKNRGALPYTPRTF